MGGLPNAGAIPDDIVGELKLARLFLTILNSSHEYKKWAKLCKSQDLTESLSDESSKSDAKHKRQYATDHTQVPEQDNRIHYLLISSLSLVVSNSFLFFICRIL